MKDISVIIVSYNTWAITQEAITRVYQCLSTQKKDLSFEIIVVDNASSDGSKEMLQSLKESPIGKHLVTIFNNSNVGFGAANNIGFGRAEGKFILLLNSDVYVEKVNFNDLITYLDTHEKVAGLTVKVMLAENKMDPASHRGFPTIWRSFTYFSGLEKLFARAPLFNYLFGGYHLTHKNLATEHEIDSPTAAFFFLRSEVFKELGGFDETFFMYGEDLDLAYRIKEKGYAIMYLPKDQVLHLKHQSGLKKSDDGKQTASKTRHHFYDAMKIFYDKHYAPHYPQFINSLVHKAIDIKAH